uniref:Uncharacterized protein n=1 Tax=Timema bartmani TaxID=61472 RepID=A0A7R9I1N5_9NEOP|nr:unnamed protein product [Timema bartmani]
MFQDYEKELEGEPGKFYPIKADMTKEEDLLAAFKWVSENLDGVDVLVNNAGVAFEARLLAPGLQWIDNLKQGKMMSFEDLEKEADDMQTQDYPEIGLEGIGIEISRNHEIVKLHLIKESDIIEDDWKTTLEGNVRRVSLRLTVPGEATRSVLITTRVGKAIDGKTDQWRQILETNILGLNICTREAYQSMKSRGVDDGHIIHINSGYTSPHRTAPHFSGGMLFMFLNASGYTSPHRTAKVRSSALLMIRRCGKK